MIHCLYVILFLRKVFVRAEATLIGWWWNIYSMSYFMDDVSKEEPSAGSPSHFLIWEWIFYRLPMARSQGLMQNTPWQEWPFSQTLYWDPKPRRLHCTVSIIGVNSDKIHSSKHSNRRTQNDMEAVQEVSLIPTIKKTRVRYRSRRLNKGRIINLGCAIVLVLIHYAGRLFQMG
jgi:hypothetical protein